MITIKQIDRENITYLVHNLEGFEKDKAIKKGLQKAGKVFETGGKYRLRKVMRKAKGVTGNLLNSLFVRVKKNKPGVLTGFIRSTKNMLIGGGNHAHLVDRGTKDRYWKSKGSKYVGKMPATRFWSDTESQDYPQAINKLYEGVEEVVYRIKNRL
ncbi:hypothetical protein JGH11_10860 [Dysgonomonas sp. Marseille-P4677]|uniref:hypothetical protein n=1 Tax=Dysgonomonas sp. Marseille-P4677 TaxID=2364790 RepID=UPI001912E894|nr:hypothetical protein [Dysgonomonas sp. Marseille-P4677]MBK5721373.1 hypothetical protein [Dysgonomonas sp. Marseille-P4677]